MGKNTPSTKKIGNKKIYYTRLSLIFFIIFIFLCTLSFVSSGEDKLSAMMSALISAFIFAIRTNVIIADDTQISVKGLVPGDNDSIKWTDIKQVQNDYPRIYLSTMTFAQEEDEDRRPLKRNGGQEHRWSGRMSININDCIGAKKLLNTILSKSIHAKIDSGIYEIF